MKRRGGSSRMGMFHRWSGAGRLARTVVLGVSLFGAAALACAGQTPNRSGVRGVTGGTGSTSDPILGVGNDVQRPVAEALHQACNQFRSFLGQGVGQENPDQRCPFKDPKCANPLTTQQQELFRACLEIEQTANFLNKQFPIEFRNPAIGSIEELAATLQQFGTEEFAAEGTHSAQVSRGHVLQNRLAALRRGASGVALADLDLRVAGLRFDPAGVKRGYAGPMGVGVGIGADGWGGARAQARDGEAASAQQGASTADEGLFESERWGLFVNGMVSFGKKRGTEREDGFEFRVPGITVGVDHRFGNDFVLGGAASYESFKGDFDTTLAVSGGDLKSRVISVSAYTTYYVDHFYIDGTLTYGWNDYDLTRNVLIPGSANRAVLADTSGTQYEATAAVGYTGHRGSFQYSPSIRASKVGTRVDGYEEGRSAAPFSLEVDSQDIDSFVSVAGGQFSWTFSGAIVIIPQARFEWHHEFQNDSRALTARFVEAIGDTSFDVPSDESDHNYFNVGAGVSTVWRGGMQAFLNVEAVLGLQNLSNYVGTAGIRFAF